MTRIPNAAIEKLRERGLFVAAAMPETHVYPNGVLIGKPTSVAGNSLPGYDVAYGLEDKIEFDAPMVWLLCNDGKWYVIAQEYSPVPGPGDFTSEWQTGEEVVQDILDFYFGNPARMNLKAAARQSIVHQKL